MVGVAVSKHGKPNMRTPRQMAARIFGSFRNFSSTRSDGSSGLGAAVASLDLPASLGLLFGESET